MTPCRHLPDEPEVWKTTATPCLLMFFYYSLVRIRKLLKVTPAMEVGVIDHLMTLEDLVALVNEREYQLKESN